MLIISSPTFVIPIICQVHANTFVLIIPSPTSVMSSLKGILFLIDTSSTFDSYYMPTTKILLWCLLLSLLLHKTLHWLLYYFSYSTNTKLLTTKTDSVFSSSPIFGVPLWTVSNDPSILSPSMYMWYLDWTLVSTRLVSWFDSNRRCACRSRSLFMRKLYMLACCLSVACLIWSFCWTNCLYR